MLDIANMTEIVTKEKETAALKKNSFECLPTLSQDPSDTGYLLTLRLPDGSDLGSPPLEPPPSRNPPCIWFQVMG